MLSRPRPAGPAFMRALASRGGPGRGLGRGRRMLKGGPPRPDTGGMKPRPARIPPPKVVPLTDVLAALSFALDLTEGQPMGHSLRSCLISMDLAERLDLPLQVRRDLYYAALLKDAGCSSNAAAVFQMFGGDEIVAKRERMVTDWSNDFTAALFALRHSAPGAS